MAKHCSTTSAWKIRFQKLICCGLIDKHISLAFVREELKESYSESARQLANTPEFAKAQRQRKKVEALFAELKNQIGLRRLRLRRLKFVREQFFLAAAAQNIKRLVRFLSGCSSSAAPELDRKTPVSSKELRRRKKEFFDDLQQH